MAKVLTSISRDSPASPLNAGVNDTFSFAGTPTLTGSGGVQRYDFRWMVNSGSGYVPMSGSTGLTVSGTNPIVNTNSQAQQSITVTCAQAGSYTVRMEGAPTTGGAYTVLSPAQTVTVTAPTALTPVGFDTGAPVLGLPAIAAIHALAAAALATGAVELGQPGIGQAHQLAASEMLAGTPVLDSPALSEISGTVALEPLSMSTGSPVLGGPTIAQVHALSIVSLASGAPVLGSPQIGEPGSGFPGASERRCRRLKISIRFGLSLR